MYPEGDSLVKKVWGMLYTVTSFLEIQNIHEHINILQKSGN